MSLSHIDIPGACCPSPTLLCGGQPSAEQLAAICAAGVCHIINLRPVGEAAGFDEDAVVEALGVGYTRIGVAGPAGLNRDNVLAFDAAMSAAGAQPTLVHCASGNRVGALMALRAAWCQGKTAEEALAIGRASGLTAMEPMVRAMLGA